MRRLIYQNGSSSLDLSASSYAMWLYCSSGLLLLLQCHQTSCLYYVYIRVTAAQRLTNRIKHNNNSEQASSLVSPFIFLGLTEHPTFHWLNFACWHNLVILIAILLIHLSVFDWFVSFTYTHMLLYCYVQIMHYLLFVYFCAKVCCICLGKPDCSCSSFLSLTYGLCVFWEELILDSMSYFLTYFLVLLVNNRYYNSHISVSKHMQLLSNTFSFLSDSPEHKLVLKIG